MLEDVRLMQYVAAIAVTISQTAESMYMTWPSPVLPQINSGNSPIGVSMTDEEASWMVSMFLLSTLPVQPLVSFLVDKIGRKGIFMLGGFLLFIPWFIIIFANDSWYLFLGRAIGGVGSTMTVSTCSIYIAEIADTDIRGKLGSAFNLMKLVGNFIVLSVGPFVSYTVLGIICAILPIIFVAIMIFIPESPNHLVRIGKREEAKQVLIRFSAKKVDNDLIEKKLMNIERTVFNDDDKVSYKEFFTQKQYRRVIYIMFGIKTLQQMCGYAAIEAYMQSIIDASQSNIDSDISSIIFGFVQIPGAIVSAFLVDKLGRKPMMIISAVGCALSLAAEGLYFFFQDYLHADVSSIAWLPTTALVVFLLISNFGIVTLPYVLTGELFSPNAKGVAVTSCTFYGSFLAFLTSKIFSPISNNWGMYTTFWIFGGFCAVGAVFSFYELPETKGKEFEEIEKKIQNKGKKHLNENLDLKLHI